MTLAIEVVPDPTNLWTDRAREWNALAEASGGRNLCLLAGWLAAWADTVGSGSEAVERGGPNLIGVTARSGSELVGAGVFENDCGVLRLAGRGVSDATDVLLHGAMSEDERKRVLAGLLNAARDAVTGFRHFELARLPEAGCAAPLLDSATVPGYFATRTARTGAPRADRSGLERAAAKKRLRQRENRLRREGAIALRTTSDPEEIAAALPAFLDLHVKRWQNTPTPSQLADGPKRAFYPALVQHLGPSGVLRYSSLEVDGRLIAAHFGFFHTGTFTYYKPAYDPDWAALSPGDVLLRHLFEEALAEGAACFDFGIGEEPYKLRFADETPHRVTLHVTHRPLTALVRRARAGVRRWVISPPQR